MENNNSSYQIIDEPKPKPWDSLIFNPIGILLLAMLLPFVWTPPFYGRLWIPLVWLIVNSWLIGSPSFFRELVFAIVGLALYFALPYIFVFASSAFGFEEYTNAAVPYLRIVMQAEFFITLYLIVFKQMVPYELFIYIKEQGQTR
ncbi:hypothetical protein NBRC116493_05390 [Aurantivibrio infirmus]